MKLIDNNNIKAFSSPDFNFIFDKTDGTMMTWGRTQKEDPEYSKYGPTILDIEVTTICDRGCIFCYKGNTKKGSNMSFDTFKNILDRMPKILTQIAFGADQSATANPDLFKMMDYSRSIGIIPNITVANISDETAKKLAEVCGAIAVSRYSLKDDCYNSVEKLIKFGAKQVNIHQMISLETFEQAKETIKDIVADQRLKGMRCIVFLSLKKKGRGERFTPLNQEQFNELVLLAEENKLNYGFDSCSAGKYLNTIKDRKNYKELAMMIEPCESSLFSSFIDVNGKYYPCSFCDKHESFSDGIDVLKYNSFIEVWMEAKTKIWRNNLIQIKSKGNMGCPIYEV